MAEKKRGRPVKYTPEIIEAGIKKYEEYLEKNPTRMPTMAGLARFTKIPRLTLHRKRTSGECGQAFDDFYDYLLQRHEEHCFTKTANGASVFVLKQYGYSDKQELEMKAEVKHTHYDQLSDEELAKEWEKRNAKT